MLSTETARRSFETSIFFQKTTADISRNGRDIIEGGHHLTIMRRRAGMTTHQERVEIWFKHFSAHRRAIGMKYFEQRRVCKNNERQTSFQRPAFVVIVPGTTVTAEK
jgi:hypothetical protein